MSTKLWKTAAIAGGISVLAAVLLLVGTVMLLLGSEQPDRYIGIWVTVILIAGAALAGALGTKMCGEKPLAASVAAGFLYTAVLCIMTLPFGEGFTPSGLLCNGLLPVAVSTGIGAVWGSRGTTRYGNRRKAAKHAGKIYKGKR